MGARDGGDWCESEMKDEEKGNDWGQGFQMAVREGEESRDFKWLTFS